MTIEPAAPTEIQSLIGLNTNLTVHDQVLHVQTEDLGRQRACIVTHVFSKGGQVVHKVRFDYSKHLSHPNLAGILPRAMQAQHLAVMQRLRHEGGEGVSQVSQIDLPCIAEENHTPSPDFLSPAPKTVRAQLEAGAWDRLVAQAKSERRRERSAMPAIPLPDSTTDPMEMTPGLERVDHRPRSASSSCWDEAVANARREYENTPTPEPLSENELAARRAYDQAMACLHRDEDEQALVLLCRAVGLEPKNPMFRARLARVLTRLGNG